MRNGEENGSEIEIQALKTDSTYHAERGYLHLMDAGKRYRRLIKPKEANKLWTINPAADSNKDLSLTA